MNIAESRAAENVCASKGMVAVSDTYQIKPYERYVHCNNGTYTVTLPEESACANAIIMIAADNTFSGAITIVPKSNTVRFSSVALGDAGDIMTFICNGVHWDTVAANADVTVTP